MISKLFSFYLAVFFLIHIVDNKVIFVFEHFRHGARSPSDLFEDDLDLMKEKWDGVQELTNVGLRQEYLLGHFIRNKYPNLINYNKYNPKEIEVLSTMANRTIMSARAQINGIFNNTTSEKIDENKNNLCVPYFLLDEINKFNINNISLYPDDFPEEVPVHIIDYNEKLLQLEKNNICPVIKDLREENKKIKEISEFIQKFNESFGEQLLDIYNINDKNYYMDYENVNDICIEAIINKVDDRELNFLKNKIDIESFYNSSLEFFRLKTSLVYANDNEGLLAYIGSSILIRKILSYMEYKIDNINNNEIQTPNLVILSSHDTAIANMEGIIDNLFNIKVLPPTYASNYLFELNKEDDNDEYYVNLIFNNETLKSIKFNDFQRIIKNNAWTYEETGKYCGFLKEIKELNDNKEKLNWKVIIIIFSILNLIMIGIIIFLFIKYYKN